MREMHLGMRSLEDPDSMMRHGKLWAEEIKRKKAKIYIFLTWARDSHLSNEKALFGCLI